ncbi:MAG: molybdopterin molybdenumtransferase MoeA, partial [Lachnospiraceae bacterium]|nr:molybdopterin molybdenumtransferase MoeA [Lachnospiraceae bacterium]
MTEYREAIRILTDSIGRAGYEEISLLEAFGRITGEDITAGENVPPFDRSPYDGYAFRAGDTDGVTADKPVTLSVIENIRAGQTASCMVTCGTAIRLMTGAPIPEGSDAVCKYEDTDYTEEAVSLKREYRPGENIIRAGE